MKYLCLVYFEPGIWDRMSKSESDQISRESSAYNEELQERGYHIAAQALQCVDTAIKVRVRNGKVSLTDVPLPRPRRFWVGFF